MILILGPGAGQSVSTTAIYPRRIYLVGGSANATAVVKAAGVSEYPIAALAGTTSPQIFAVGQDTAFGSQSLPGPITADVTGTGAQLVIEW